MKFDLGGGDSIWISERENRSLNPYLAGVGLVGVFARYVAALRPNSTSLAAAVGVDVKGVAVFGRSMGLYEAASCWIFADAEDAFERILHRVDSDGVAPLNFAPGYSTIVGLNRAVSVDRLYAMLDPVATTLPESIRVESLTRRRLMELTIHPELVPSLGRLEDIPDGFPYFGYVRNGVLVALAESVVRDDASATIQQVITVSSERCRGLGRAVVAEVARDILRQGLVPTYLVAEENAASIALVESLGFVLESTWGYAADPAGAA